MKIRTSILSLSAILMVAAIPARTNEKDIVDTAVAAGSFKTLVKLVKDAGLVETLKSAGPFTVLAPTDAAFAKVPKAVLKKLAGNKELLKSVLTYHVISGKVLSTDLKEGSVKTVQGESVKINLHGGAFFNKSKVVKADIMTSNGVIHVIDSVLLPPSVAAKL
ncbi:MAG: fasciclin domain-containing protein [Armatimonadota bacterium]